MSKITPVTAVSFGVLLALIALFAYVQHASAASYPPLRVGLACNPPTNAQSYRDANGDLQIIKSGDEQICRVKVQHRAGNRTLISGGDTTTPRDDVYLNPPPITGITYTHPTPNNAVAISASIRTPGGYFLSAVACDQQTFTCDPVDLEYGQSLLVVETLHFDIGLDGRSRTKAYASGEWNGKTLSSSGLEQTTLP